MNHDITHQISGMVLCPKLKSTGHRLRHRTLLTEKTIKMLTFPDVKCHINLMGDVMIYTHQVSAALRQVIYTCRLLVLCLSSMFWKTWCWFILLPRQESFYVFGEF
jgi:hypothetical protein